MIQKEYYNPNADFTSAKKNLQKIKSAAYKNVKLKDFKTIFEKRELKIMRIFRT